MISHEEIIAMIQWKTGLAKDKIKNVEWTVDDKGTLKADFSFVPEKSIEFIQLNHLDYLQPFK